LKKKIVTAVFVLAMVFSCFSTTAFAASSASLKKGSSGNDVKELQTLLNLNGFSLAVDGKFSTATEQAVKKYQQASGLKVDGIAGSSTLRRLNNVENFIAVAKTKIGCRYVHGGKGPNVFDCSGFVYWSLNHSGIKQSYMTSAIWQKCKKYTKITGMENLRRGDIISLRGHVAIYLGNGQAINSLGSAHGVTISNNIMKSHYWTGHFVCGFRVF
jgi:peptidoglycan DL-endopeptidase CwlO